VTALDSLPLIGALGLEQTRYGVIPRRLPQRAWPQLVDPALELVTRMPAGVRLSFLSGPAWLELVVKATAVKVLDNPVLVPLVDIVVDGTRIESVPISSHDVLHITGPGEVSLLPGEPCTLRFELPVDPGAVVELWLPHNAVVELREVRSSEPLQAAPRTARRWVHHGSSISHCLEAVRPTETWPAVAALKAGLDLTHLGFGGQCMLDQHTARAIRDTEADLISIKAGINIVNADSMRERTYRPALHGFLDTVREGHPDTPIVLVTAIICPSAEDHPGPTVAQADGRYGVVPRAPELAIGALTLRRTRELAHEVVASRGDPNLHLLDGRLLFGEDDVHDLPDALHPNAAGYLRMGERFHRLVFSPEGLLPQS
jgi:hypothetical protein